MTLERLRPTLAEIEAALEADGDFLKPIIRTVLQEVLEAEMTEALGAAKGERTEGRLRYRSGYYTRALITRIGQIELKIPQDRQGRLSTELFERYQRSEKALVAALAEMYVQGVSTRKVKAITEELIGPAFVASSVSAIVKKLDGELLFGIVVATAWCARAGGRPWRPSASQQIAGRTLQCRSDPTLFLHERALALRKRHGGLLARYCAKDFVVVPRTFRLVGAFDLDKVHIVNKPAILTDPGTFREEIVDRNLTHFRRDRLAVVGARGLHRLQVMEYRRIDTRLNHAGLALRTRLESSGEVAAGVVPVPVIGRRGDQSLRAVDAHGVHVADHDNEPDELLPALGYAELSGLLDCVDRVGSGVGEPDNRGAGTLRLQQKGREVAAARRVPDLTYDLAASGRDLLGQVRRHLMPERIIGDEEEPLLTPFL
jgi:Transposase, Mutator family